MPKTPRWTKQLFAIFAIALLVHLNLSSTTLNAIKTQITDAKASSNDNRGSRTMDDCFTARRNTVPPASYGKLQKPFINLGMPKMGSSSLHSFFKCGTLKSHHYRCGQQISCTKCITQSIEAGQPPFSQCADGDAYSQIDVGHIFPQMEYLDEIISAYPNATYLLTFRSMAGWYRSITHWPPRKNGPHMSDRMRKSNITGFPSGVGRNQTEFSDWFCGHVRRVRDVVARRAPAAALVEIDIEDSMMSERMEELFGIGQSCWGKVNVNAKIHPGANRSEIIGSKVRLTSGEYSNHNRTSIGKRGKKKSDTTVRLSIGESNEHNLTSKKRRRREKRRGRNQTREE